MAVKRHNVSCCECWSQCEETCDFKATAPSYVHILRGFANALCFVVSNFFYFFYTQHQK